jgi:hypothetical protein
MIDMIGEKIGSCIVAPSMGNITDGVGFSIFPSPTVMSLTNLSLGGNNLYMTSLFPPRESLVSDIPAGEGNIEKLVYGVNTHFTW